MLNLAGSGHHWTLVLRGRRALRDWGLGPRLGDLMALRIEDYALIGDTHTVSRVGTNGSVDWLCLPRFDAPACFASLLGTEDNGFWQIAPRDGVSAVRRRYRGPTLVLETEVETAQGAARLVDCMPPRGSHPRIVRVVGGVGGEAAR